MNRGELKTLALARRSWKPSEMSGSEFQQDLNTLVQGALDELATTCPSALVPFQDRQVLLPAWSSTDTVKMATTSDPWVLQFTPHLLVSADVERPYPLVDGTWDGIYHIEITTPDGVKHRRQSREFFSITNDALGFYKTFYVSLTQPFAGTYTDLAFRIHAPQFYLKDNITKVRDGTLFTEQRERIPLGKDFFSGGYFDQRAFFGAGRPTYVVRGDHFQMPAPNYTPPVQQLDSTTWLGPEAPGKFRYRYTYVWGKKDPEICAPGGSYDPQWESGPSPESVQVEAPSVGGASIKVTLPNIDWELGFGDSGTLRYSRSGFRKRIYRARDTVNAGGTQPIESPGIYQFLAEVDGTTTTYIDRGAVVPDYYRRLPEISGYYGYGIYPNPDKRYEIDLRCDRRPEKLLVDSDVPPVEPAAMQCLVDLFVANLALLDKQLEDHAYWKNAANASIATFRSIAGHKTNSLAPNGYQARGYRHPAIQTPLGSYRSG